MRDNARNLETNWTDDLRSAVTAMGLAQQHLANQADGYRLNPISVRLQGGELKLFVTWTKPRPRRGQLACKSQRRELLTARLSPGQSQTAQEWILDHQKEKRERYLRQLFNQVSA